MDNTLSLNTHVILDKSDSLAMKRYSVSGRAQLHRTVITLGYVSLLMDMSSEAIHSLLPLFMLNVLGLSALAIGLLDGAAEALTLFIKPFSGWLSDKFQKRKSLTVLGYGMAALTKPLFAIAQGLGLIILARFMDRVGKGIRGAPRDALIADVTPAALRGRAYGLRQAMDTVGALIGPLLAATLMWFFAGEYRHVFWLASVPAFVAVMVLWFFVHETDASPPREKTPNVTTNAVSKPLYFFIVLACLVTFSRPSEAFLLLRGASVDIAEIELPLLLATMNAAYALLVYPVGIWFDRIGAFRLLVISLVVLIFGLFTLAFSHDGTFVHAAAALWGIHLAFSQGVLAALISLHSPQLKRGTAFGIYAFFVGLSYVLNGALIGSLWQNNFIQQAFLLLAGFATFTLCIVIYYKRIIQKSAIT